MAIPDPYFKNVPGVGDLKMEQVIVDYAYPLLSVLQDKFGMRYLCMCFDTRGAQQWLITSIPNVVLAALLENKVTLSSPFENPGTEKIKVIMDYHTREETFQRLRADQIQREELPDAGEYLDAEPGEWAAYIGRLLQRNGVILYRGVLSGKQSVKWKDARQRSKKAGRYIHVR